MSNEALRSKVYELERELSHAQNINRELKNELSIVSNGVLRVHRELENYNASINNTLTDCNNKMLSSHNRVIEAYELQGEIEKLYKRYKNIELANKKIRACNNKKYYDFANYRTVRKIVQGIMDNLDVSMISDSIITKSIEKQHLQVPDYWLTCVLISIMAWKNDDKELADRAMARALKLDKKSSAVFYMLFNLRMSREDAALKWFYMYKDCELKGSDQRTFLMLFSLVSKTITDDIDVAEKTRTQIFEFIKKVIADNIRAAGYSEEGIVNQIRYFFNRMQPNDQMEYPLIKRNCVESSRLSDILLRAKNNKNILELLKRTINVSLEQKNEFVKNFIDELIANPNDEEKSVYDEITYNELVIKFEGDMEAAKTHYDREAARIANDLNLISDMINWIHEKDAQEINGQTRLNMLTLTKELHDKAVISHVDDYRALRKTTLPVKINDYASEVDFNSEELELRKVQNYFQEKKKEALAEIKKIPAFIAFGIAAASAAGAFYAGDWLFALTTIGLGYGVFVLISNKSKRKQLELQCKNNTRITSDTLSKMFTEFKQYRAEINEYDGYYDQIVNEIAKI